MRIAVTGIGIISGIGRGADQTLGSIRSNRTGLGPVTLFDTIHDLLVSEVKFSNADLSEMVAAGSRRKYTHTALLGMLAARDAVEDSAPNASDQLRTGLVSS
ncbi:MAG: beta-ketoacyl-[acyl-carrier-protein] synthase family protein, partial [Alistipes sp.]|nr:beta-ketoacyl-[acyl-carrier-protein] synthase family protein [Alistipes sp.]